MSEMITLTKEQLDEIVKRETLKNELSKFTTRQLIEEIEHRNGGVLKGFRRALNMTQLELGEYLGVDKTSVCSWETGRIKLPIERKIQLLDLARTKELNDWWFKLGEVLT